MSFSSTESLNFSNNNNNNNKPRCQICDGEEHIGKYCFNRYTRDSANLAEACRSASPDESKWYFDSGAAAHMARSPTTLDASTPYSGNNHVVVGNGSFLKISHTGSLELNSSLRLLDVLVVPEITQNLVSISKLTSDFPVNVVFNNHSFTVQTRETGEILATGRREGKLYILDKNQCLGNSKIRFTEQSFGLLPREILEQILSRLPVKSLLRFRCVSKSWRSLISSERFIRTQFRNSRRDKSFTHHKIIFHPKEGVGLKQCPVINLSGELYTNRSSLTDDPTINEGYVVGCWNGLVCIRNQRKGCFLLCNPATRISFELPGIERVIQACGFGYDVASVAYKVFVVVVVHYKLQIGKVYSSKINSWRTTLGMEDLLWRCYGTGMFVCGKIHWLGPQSIYSFDLKSEVLGEIERPRGLELGHQQQWLGEIKGCLSLVCDNNNTRELGVWIMKESWLKVLNVPIDLPYGYRSFTALIEVVSEGVVLMIYGSALMVRTCGGSHVLSAPKKPTLRFKMHSSRYDATHIYVESLVSPVPYPNLSTG